jgi:hypothetical protein
MNRFFRLVHACVLHLSDEAAGYTLVRQCMQLL